MKLQGVRDPLTIKWTGDIESCEIGLLWRTNVVNFPDNYSNAMGGLTSLERQLNKQPVLKELQTFKDYDGKEYIRKLTPSELLKINSRMYFTLLSDVCDHRHQQNQAEFEATIVVWRRR